jgi:hypothetical protein
MDRAWLYFVAKARKERKRETLSSESTKAVKSAKSDGTEGRGSLLPGYLPFFSEFRALASNKLCVFAPFALSRQTTDILLKQETMAFESFGGGDGDLAAAQAG